MVFCKTAGQEQKRELNGFFSLVSVSRKMPGTASGQRRDRTECGVRNWDFELLDFPAFRVIRGQEDRPQRRKDAKEDKSGLLTSGFRLLPQKVFRKIVKILENVTISN